MSTPRDSGDHDRDRYYYRRRLNGGELLPAIGTGVVVGLLVFYVARLVAQRTPLAPERRPAGQRLRPVVRTLDA
jgi:hypothetical protein